jgi:pimeloyl-ACP methyl ester carboxylesterase
VAEVLDLLPVTRPKRVKPLFAQLKVLSKAIESILRRGLEGEYDDYLVRRNIEKVHPTDEVLQIKILEEEESLRPVTEIRFYSHVYEKEFYIRKDYLIPSGDGFAISLKEVCPRNLNNHETTLLLIPGFFCNRVFMDDFARLMALKYGYRCISLDVRGRSPETLSAKFGAPHWNLDDYIWKDFPAAIRFIKEKYGYKIVPMGHSMGGQFPRFYSAVFEDIKKLNGNRNLPDPKDYLRGIVSIASPSSIDLRPNQKLFIRNLSTVLNFIPQAVRDQAAAYIAMAFPSLNLHEIINGLNKIHEPLRELTFYIKSAIPTLDQFIGDKDITPAKFYFLLENVLCNESTLVLKQFVDAQLDGKSFYSYDHQINYTSYLHKLSLPLFSVIGKIDEIVPPHTIEPYDKLATHPLNKMKYVNQGHLGIGISPPTVRETGAQIHRWIKKLLLFEDKAV